MFSPRSNLVRRSTIQVVLSLPSSHLVLLADLWLTYRANTVLVVAGAHSLMLVSTSPLHPIETERTADLCMLAAYVGITPDLALLGALPLLTTTHREGHVAFMCLGTWIVAAFSTLQSFNACSFA